MKISLRTFVEQLVCKHHNSTSIQNSFVDEPLFSFSSQHQWQITWNKEDLYFLFITGFWKAFGKSHSLIVVICIKNLRSSLLVFFVQIDISNTNRHISKKSCFALEEGVDGFVQQRMKGMWTTQMNGWQRRWFDGVGGFKSIVFDGMFL